MPVVVAFLSQKGGVGKSTLARALAVHAAESGVKVFVADLDTQQQTIKHWNDRRDSHAIQPEISVANFDDVAQALSATENSQLLIVDTSGRASAATLDIAKHAHVVVQPTGVGLDDLHPGVLLFHELVGGGIPVDRLIFALCRVLTKDEEHAAREYLGKTPYAVLTGSIAERAQYRYAQNVGRSLVETDDKSLNDRTTDLLDGLLSKMKSEIDRTKLLNSAAQRAVGAG